ncbi:MAG: hypothetical protein DRQ55_08855 [Planctomycetota bacterium]|nr:MAG: hypothetical protein DRQ55_08855 [Planctomycetota bacterium]
MDVYFERIAGVSAPKSAQEQAAAPAVTPAPANSSTPSDALDANGFPLSPMQDQDHLWFVQAAGLHRPLAGAASVARTMALSLIISGALTALVGGLGMATGGTPVPLVLGLVLVTLGSIDRGSASALVAADPSAPGKLARNQLVLFGVLGAATWSSGLGRLSLPSAERLAQLPDELSAPIAALEPLLTSGLLVATLGFLGLVHGCLALYFISRRRRVTEFHTELPPWVAQVVVTIAGR